MTLYEHKLKNAYIGEVWTPNANTLMYLPLEKDATDKSGRTDISISTTATNVSYGTLGGVQCAIVNNNGYININTEVLKPGLTEGTISFIRYLDSTHSYSNPFFMEYWSDNKYGVFGSNSASPVYVLGSIVDGYNTDSNKWIHCLYTADSSSAIAYVNGQEVLRTNNPSTIWGTSTATNTGKRIFSQRRDANFWKGGGREIILESVKWTPTQVSNYYNQIKQQLGF